VYLFFEVGPKLEKLGNALVAALNGIRDALGTKDEMLAAIKAAQDRIDQLDKSQQPPQQV